MVKLSKLSKKFSIKHKKIDLANRKRKAVQKDINLGQSTNGEESRSLIKDNNPLSNFTMNIATNEDNKDDNNDEFTQHRKQLESLKDTDPDFYNFLKEQDEALLNFQNESSSSEGDYNELLTKKKQWTNDDDDDQFSSDYDDSNEDSIDDLSDDKDEKSLNVSQSETVEMFDETIDKLFKQSMDKSIHSLKHLLKCFHSIVYNQFCDNLSEPVFHSIFNHKEHQIYHHYRINAVYPNKNSVNKIINFGLKQLCIILLEMFNEKNLKNSNSLKRLLKIYYIDQFVMLNYLGNSSDSLVSIINSIKLTSKLLFRYSKIFHAYVKLFVGMLEHSDEDVRICCFNILQKWSQTKHSDSIYQQIDKIYLKKSGFSKYHDTYDGLWLFLKVSLCELLVIRPTNAYNILFKLCKKIIIDLQNSIVNNDKKSVSKIYSWHFIHCIDLVTCTIYNETNSESILHSNLTYPISQIALAALNNASSPKFFPFKLHILKCLVKLVSNTKVYIPLSTHLIKLLENKELMVVGTSVIPPNVKEPILNRMLKVSKEQTKLNQYKAAVFNLTVDYILQFMIVFSNHVAFPDLVFFPLKWIRKIINNTKVKRQSIILKNLVQKIEEHARKISDIRFTMEEGSSIFNPIKSNHMPLEDTSFIKLPIDQNYIAKYLDNLREKNFDEPRQNSNSTPCVAISSENSQKYKKNNKFKHTLKKSFSKFKSMSSSTLKTSHDLDDQVVDLNLSDS